MKFPFVDYFSKQDSYLFFQKDSGEIIIGQGPFERLAEPSTEAACFYFNDFGLNNERPWLLPSQLVDLETFINGELAAPLAIELEKPSSSDFGQVFEGVLADIHMGKIQKSVPVATELGKVSVSQRRQLVINALRHETEGKFYGFYHPDLAFIGHSPELLFSIQGEKLSTMALAGTAQCDEIEVFSMDEKEIKEHEFVVNSVMSQLGEFGSVVRENRKIKILGDIVHFQSGIQVWLNNAYRLNELIKVLHPTPALGPLPRTRESLSQLNQWRDSLNCPGVFGAPFGYIDQEGFTSLVGIRGVYWEGDQLSIPSGCGIIEASRLTNEWRELKLKREVIKKLFGINP